MACQSTPPSTPTQFACIACAGLDIMVDPPYNPFWVLEGTTFRASCSAEVSDLEWFIDGSSPKLSGYEERRTSTPLTGGVRTTVTISKSKMGWDVSPNIICRSPSAGKDVVVGVNIFAGKWIYRCKFQNVRLDDCYLAHNEEVILLLLCLFAYTVTEKLYYFADMLIRLHNHVRTHSRNYT